MQAWDQGGPKAKWGLANPPFPLPAASSSPKEGVASFPKQLKKGMTSVKPKIGPESLTRQNFAHQCISINNYLWRAVTGLVFNSLNICPLNAI